MTSDTNPCPCGLPATYGECCALIHRGKAAATAELLMRSRYSAFVVLDEPYLLRSWHPDTRPAALGLNRKTRWLGLDVLSTTEGGPFHTEGTVAFRARYSERGHKEAIEENSRFVRHEGAWVYLDAQG